MKERRDSARVLLAGECYHDSVYLFGYAAEIVLKRAYYRLTGATVLEDVSSRFAPARLRGKSLYPGASFEGGHSLLFGSLLLEAERVTQYGRVFSDDTFLYAFQSVTQRLHRHWQVEMRYYNTLVNRSLALSVSVQADVEWLINHQPRLWRR